MNNAVSDTLNTPRAWAIELAAGAVAGVVMGITGPFGSFFNDSLAVRLAYWIMVCLLSALAVGAAVRLAWPSARRQGVATWIWVPVVSLLVSLPLAVVTRLIAMGFWPNVRDAVGWVEWYGQTALVAFVYMSIHVAAYARMPAGTKTPSADAARILDRLPHRLGRDLLCLQMEDHYVRLHTPHGSVLILSSLGRAIEQVGGIEGMRVHRSWWVARHAVQGVVHDGRRLRLALTSGLEAPVSRAKVAELKAAGWLGASVSR